MPFAHRHRVTDPSILPVAIVSKLLISRAILIYDEGWRRRSPGRFFFNQNSPEKGIAGMPPQSTSELRKDPHHGGWVLVASQPEREQLMNIPLNDWPLQSPDALVNPEAAGAIVLWRRSLDLSNGSKTEVMVAANRFPLYRVEGPEERKGKGVYDYMRGVGAHEVIIESVRLEDTLPTMSPRHYAMALQAMQDRINDLKRDTRLRSFSIFREWTAPPNGLAAPPHSQLIASSVLPSALETELSLARSYYVDKERCLYCDIISQELHDQERLVREEEHFVAFCPYASRAPFEIHLYPRQHIHDFADLPNDYLTSLAGMIRETASRLEQTLPGWRILMTMHTAPTAPASLDFGLLSNAFHWHLEFIPKPPAGLDWHSRAGTHVIHTAPETSAEQLRSLRVPAPEYR